MRKKNRPPIKPDRGYQWLGAVWIGSISLFLTVGTVLEGQITLGAPEGTLIKADERPLIFWASVAFPATVTAVMITLLIRGELQYRDQRRAYQQKLEDRDQ